MNDTTNQPQEQGILIASNSTEPSLPPRSDILTTTLVYGGVAVAVIFAMTFFCHILLTKLTEMFRERKD